MVAAYGFSQVHEPQPRKRVSYRVTPKVKRPVGRPRKQYIVGITPQQGELTMHTVEVALPGSPDYVCVHGINLHDYCTTCNGEDNTNG